MVDTYLNRPVFLLLRDFFYALFSECWQSDYWIILLTDDRSADGPMIYVVAIDSHCQYPLLYFRERTSHVSVLLYLLDKKLQDKHIFLIKIIH